MQMAIADEEEFKAETRRKWHCGRRGGSGRRDFDRELLYILDRIFRSNSNDIIRTYIHVVVLSAAKSSKKIDITQYLYIGAHDIVYYRVLQCVI